MALTLRVSRNGAAITIEGASVGAVLALEALFDLLRDSGSIAIRPAAAGGGSDPLGGGSGRPASRRRTRDLGPAAKAAARRAAKKTTARKTTAKKTTAKKTTAKKTAKRTAG
jgi:hypothetical protein